MTEEFDMDNFRKKWRDELVEGLCKLVEPAEALQVLIKEHPDYSFLREDVIQVLRGNDGARRYISGNVGLELSKLFDLLKLSRDAIQNDRRHYMFLRPVEPDNYEFISVAHGKSIKVIRLPKYMHQDDTLNFSVAIVLVHDMSRPPSSFAVSVHANSFQAYGASDATQEERDQIKEDYWNSFTILYDKEFGLDEISTIEEPFRPILDKLWEAIKDGENYFDFNEHINLY